MKTRKTNKKGISLIVLVITIIVMIILAAAIILSLSSNGIIDRANEAVDKTDIAQVQTLASTIWADAYLDNLRGIELKQKVKNEFRKNKGTEKYAPIVTDTGVTVTEWETIYTGDENSYTQEGMLVLGSENLFNTVDPFRFTVESDEYTGYIETTLLGVPGISTYIIGAIDKAEHKVRYFTSIEEEGQAMCALAIEGTEC